MTKTLAFVAASFGIAAVCLAYADKGLLCYCCIGAAMIAAAFAFDEYENDHT